MPLASVDNYTRDTITLKPDVMTLHVLQTRLLLLEQEKLREGLKEVFSDSE